MATLHIDSAGLSGALYLTNERLVFVGYEAGIVFKMVKDFSLMRIREIRAAKTMFIIPNALDITIENNERLTIIIQGRDTWLTAIREGAAAARQPSEGNTPPG